MNRAEDTLEGICQRIGEKLEDLARIYACGLITEAQFIDLLLKIEAEEVLPHGFTLTASNTIDNWTVFKLRMDGCKEPCAAFEFLPETSEFRRPGSGPRLGRPEEA